MAVAVAVKVLSLYHEQKIDWPSASVSLNRGDHLCPASLVAAATSASRRCMSPGCEGCTGGDCTV